jgi:hypothetical protein
LKFGWNGVSVALKWFEMEVFYQSFRLIKDTRRELHARLIMRSLCGNHIALSVNRGLNRYIFKKQVSNFYTQEKILSCWKMFPGFLIRHLNWRRGLCRGRRLDGLRVQDKPTKQKMKHPVLPFL